MEHAVFNREHAETDGRQDTEYATEYAERTQKTAEPSQNGSETSHLVLMNVPVYTSELNDSELTINSSLPSLDSHGILSRCASQTAIADNNDL